MSAGAGGPVRVVRNALPILTPRAGWPQKSCVLKTVVYKTVAAAAVSAGHTRILCTIFKAASSSKQQPAAAVTARSETHANIVAYHWHRHEGDVQPWVSFA